MVREKNGLVLGSEFPTIMPICHRLQAGVSLSDADFMYTGIHLHRPITSRNEAIESGNNCVLAHASRSTYAISANQLTRTSRTLRPCATASTPGPRPRVSNYEYRNDKS